MRLCTPYPNITQWASFYNSGVLSVYELAAQFNFHYPNVFAVGRPLQAVIKQTLAANSTGEILRIAPQLYTNRSHDQCLEWNNAKLTGAGASVGIQLGSWNHVECIAMTGGTSDIGPGNVFPARDDTYNSTGRCTSQGVSPAFAQLGNDEVIRYFHLDAEHITKAGRILFTQGGYDPTTGVGPPPLPLRSDKDASRTVLMYGNAHTEETMSERWGPAAKAEGREVPDSISEVSVFMTQRMRRRRVKC